MAGSKKGLLVRAPAKFVDMRSVDDTAAGVSDMGRFRRKCGVVDHVSTPGEPESSSYDRPKEATISAQIHSSVGGVNRCEHSRTVI